MQWWRLTAIQQSLNHSGMHHDSVTTGTGSAAAPAAPAAAAAAAAERITAATIIDALGGTSTVATALGVTPPAVSHYRANGAFPGRHWLRLAALAAERGVPGVTLEM